MSSVGVEVPRANDTPAREVRHEYTHSLPRS
jgi:hypothetical protein